LYRWIQLTKPFGTVPELSSEKKELICRLTRIASTDEDIISNNNRLLYFSYAVDKITLLLRLIFELIEK